MKKLRNALLAVALLFNLLIPMNLLPVVADDSAPNPNGTVSVYVDGEKIAFDINPIIENGRTLVPLRGVFEKLGATVDWNKQTNQVIVKTDADEILLEPGNLAVLRNGRVNFLDAASKTVDDRTLIPLRFVAESLGCTVNWNSDSKRVDITSGENAPVQNLTLPTVDSYNALTELLRYNDVLNNYVGGDKMMIRSVDAVVGAPVPATAPTSSDTASKAVSENAGASDYSGTNTQTEGVDEGDILKTNGKYIFTISGNNVLTIDPTPISPKILSTIELSGKRGYVSELYATDNRLTVIGSGSVMYNYPAELAQPFGKNFTPAYYTTNTFVLVYDITNPEKPILIKDMDFEGNYVSSRLIEDKLYLVTDKSFQYYRVYGGPVPMPAVADSATTMVKFAPGNGGYNPPDYYGLSEADYKKYSEALNEYQNKPKYIDNLTGEKSVVDYKNISYFPDYVAPDFLFTVGMDLTSGTLDVNSYLGSASTIYASADKLYLTFTKYEYVSKDTGLIYTPEYKVTTSVYRFGLSGGKIAYEAKGAVPGTVLNQFSLDEYNGNLRIATTTGEMWNTANPSKNNVYILGKDLKEIGKVTDLAPGERIYSTRFAENRIYMVTFRQVDPFFVIDATDPTAPKVIGQLKIPGFSSYMHLLDENHILGFGTDTVEKDGRVTTGGFKISLFDVTDPANPIEEKKEVIGTAGTYSELSNNHKALMISPSKGIMGFPITVSSKTPYAQDFNGAYVYDITTDSFNFRGSVSHLSDGTKYGSGITRLLYIGDYLYSFSNGKMLISNLKDLSKASELTLPNAYQYAYATKAVNATTTEVAVD